MDRGERDESRGGVYDACDESTDCPASTEGCWGIVVDYVDYRTEERGTIRAHVAYSSVSEHVTGSVGSFYAAYFPALSPVNSGQTG